MNRAFAISVIEFNAMRTGATQPCRVKTIDLAGPAGNRHIAAGTNSGDDSIRLGCDVAGASGNHDAQRIQQVTFRSMPDLVAEIAPVNPRDKIKKRCSRPLIRMLPVVDCAHGRSHYFPEPSIRLIIAG